MQLDAQMALDYLRSRRDEILKLPPLRGQKKADEWQTKFRLMGEELDRFYEAIRSKRLELLGEEIDFETLRVEAP